MLERIFLTFLSAAAGLFFLFSSCSDSHNPGSLEAGGNLSFDYSFQASSAGFECGFADYPQSEAQGMELTFERRRLPSGMDTTGYGLWLSGRNSSDDLFMYVKKRLGPQDGLEPGRVYRVRMEIRIATAAASGCMGAGGSPGEAQFMKAGVTAVEPVSAPDQEGFSRINIQKGQQASGGTDMRVIGDVGNSSGDCTGATWEYKNLTLEEFDVQAGPEASLWLVAGTDSGFEGINSYYFTAFSVTLTPTSLKSLPTK